MYGDFGLVSFRAANGFSRVLAQQGRMLLESELNEQTAIHHHYLRSLIVDLVGRCWRAGDDGFALQVPGKDSDDFNLTAGHLYVDGILCEAVAGVTYGTQPFWPVPGATPGGAPQVPTAFLAYAECWERLVSAAQRPDLREIALAGRDTASRAQVVWQIRLLSVEALTAEQTLVHSVLDIRAKHPDQANLFPISDLNVFRKSFDNTVAVMVSSIKDGKNSCGDARTYLDALGSVGPLLRARAKYDTRNVDPCAISPDSEFRSRENQLYRVEIHTPGAAGTATFKWSRENGSVVFRVPSVTASKGGVLSVQVETLGRDRRSGLCEGDWVELTSDAFEFGAVAAPLGQVTKIDRPRRVVTLSVSGAANIDYTECTLLRRWDQDRHQNIQADGTIPVVESAGWLALERGVQVQFVPGGLYRTGDYWLIPARVESGDVIWPQGANGPQALPPDGVERHRGVLGFGMKKDTGWTFFNCACVVKPQCGDA
jgi:hypothetical protein